MTNHLMKWKDDFRILPELDQVTNDLPRCKDGTINKTYDDIYIACQHGNKIYSYGHMPHKRPILLVAYIPSLQRGHNIIKALKEKGIEYTNYEENDSEVLFRFDSKYIYTVAELLKAKTLGKGTSPFSSKNLPKSDIYIPESLLNKYKNAVKGIVNPLEIKKINNEFLKIIEKKERKKNKNFDVKKDMKLKCMSRQTKEYIYSMGYIDEYINVIDEYNKSENKNMFQENTI